MKLKNMLNEGRFREGDIVVPNVGPHKGVKHIIIYDFGDGKYNIQPIGLRPNKIQYRLGSAGAREDQLKKVGSTPQQPAPEIMDTSGMSKPEIAKALGDMTKKKGLRPNESINEAPMDDRFAKEYEKSTKAFINHIKHELTSAEGADKSVLKKMLQNLMTVSGYPKLMGRMTGIKESKNMKKTKLKDLLEGYAWEREPGKPLPTLKDVADKHLKEAPISRAKVDYSTANLKSNIDIKWSTTEIMENDLRQWLEATFQAVGPNVVREIGLTLKEIGISAIKDGSLNNPEI